MSDNADQLDTAALDPTEVARTVGQTSDEELREGMSGPMRAQILAEVFKRMEEHVNPQAAQDGVIHWRITGRPDGGEDHWEVVVKDATCSTSPELSRDARVTLSLDGVDFLKLVTGNAQGPALFMSGRLKIEGDLMFSAQIQSMFRIPGS